MAPLTAEDTCLIKRFRVEKRCSTLHIDAGISFNKMEELH